MIRFSSTQQSASEPATTPIASVVAEPPEIPAPTLELTAEPIARTPAKRSKLRTPQRKASGTSKDVPQLAFEE